MKSSGVDVMTIPKAGLACLLLAVLCAGPLPAAEGDDAASFEEFGELSFDEEQKQQEDEEAVFEDRPLQEPLTYPDWFTLSFLHLREDLQDAVDKGKDGLIVFFGQKYCPYCKALLEVNFGKSDIVTYTRRHFDLVAVDVHGTRTVTGMGGEQLSERAFADREKTNFTPSLIFYDEQGEEALRLRGYYPPYDFRAALEYVADDHHEKETFRDFLERAGLARASETEGLNKQPFFADPPYFLDRTRIPAERPLAVFFEQGDCHACDVLHEGPLQNMVIQGQLEYVDAVQLNMWADTPVVTPGGERTTAAEWAEVLGLFYTPTIIFFDEHGEEIIRVDSVVHFYRLRGVLDYVLSGAYKEGRTFQQWRRGPLPGGRPSR